MGRYRALFHELFGIEKKTLRGVPDETHLMFVGTICTRKKETSNTDRIRVTCADSGGGYIMNVISIIAPT